jgi:DNA-directed RNA polymerase specialized sigma24 family protein
MIAAQLSDRSTGTWEVSTSIRRQRKLPPKPVHDAVALERGYRACEQVALGYATKLVGEFAPDIVNHAATMLIMRAEDLEDPKPIPTDAVEFRKLFLTIVRTTSIDIVRAWKRSDMMKASLRTIYEWDPPRGMPIEDPGLSAETQLAFVFDTVASELTPRRKEIINLLLEGFTRADIMKMLKISGGTYDGHLQGAYASMRQSLQRQLPDLTVTASDWEGFLLGLVQRWEQRQAKRTTQ